MASATNSPSADTPAPSLRTRIVLTGLALVLLVLLAQAGAMVITLEQMEEELIDQILNQQIEYSIELARRSPEFAAPNTPDMKLYRIDPRTPTLPAELTKFAKFADLKVGNHEVHVDNRELHVAVRDDNGYRFILAYDIEEHETRLHILKFSLTISTLLLAGFLLGTVLLLARRLTGHLEQLAKRVGNRPPGETFARPGMDREVLAIAEALDRYDDQRNAALERERNFTADISHELRTPLTRIRTDAELLAGIPDLATAARKRADSITATVDQIHQLAASLLLLARETSPTLIEAVAVRDAIDEVWRALRAQHGGGTHLDNRVPADAHIKGDPALLNAVLRNILDNALRHAPDGIIVCTLSGTRLAIHDDGPGFAADELPDVFARRRGQSSGGHGLGLAIVRHVAQASGWHAHAQNAPDGGAVIEIDFGSGQGGEAQSQPGKHRTQPVHRSASAR